MIDPSAELPPEVEQALEQAADDTINVESHHSALDVVNVVLKAAAEQGYYLQRKD